MSDVLSRFHVRRHSQPSLVPLCRLVPNETARMATSDASWLVPLFYDNTYLENMGTFLVSIKDTNGDLMPITPIIQQDWDPIWVEKSNAFDAQCNDEWADLKGSRFLVWDGNHRLKTWMKRIRETKLS